MFEDLIKKKEKHKIVIKKFPIEISNKRQEKEKRFRRVEKLIKYAKSLDW